MTGLAKLKENTMIGCLFDCGVELVFKGRRARQGRTPIRYYRCPKCQRQYSLEMEE